jgi:hypothetical protein
LIYREKGAGVVLVSLARAGTPAGILIKRYLKHAYRIDVPHYTISIVRGRGIDSVAMGIILNRHNFADIQFVDGWTGKGAILGELIAAVAGETATRNNGVAQNDSLKKNKRTILNERKLLAVLADPANITDICGTHDDLPIASSFLNSTVCGLMSRTVIRPGIEKGELHGVAFFEELRDEDRTYEFINRIEGQFLHAYHKNFQTFFPVSQSSPPAISQQQDEASEYRKTEEESNEDAIKNDEFIIHVDALIKGIDEVREIAEKFQVSDINFVKPGIGEATRVLLRRVPDTVLIAEDAEHKYIAHLVQLAAEKDVPVVYYPLKRYRACGIIKTLPADA